MVLSTISARTDLPGIIAAFAFANKLCDSFLDFTVSALAARAEANAEAARAETVKSKKESQSLLAKAKAAIMPGKSVRAEMVESTIPGKFRGWEPHQTFILANGQ